VFDIFFKQIELEKIITSAPFQKWLAMANLRKTKGKKN